MAITIGATTEIDASGAAPVDVCKLTDTLAISIYGGGAGDPGKFFARTITISGATFTPNAEVEVASHSDSVTDCRIVPLSTTSAMVVYYNSGFSFRVGARVLTVSGTTITVNSETVLTDRPNGDDISIAALSASQVMLAYTKLTGNDGWARILSVSGTTITENAAYQITTNGQCFVARLAALTSTTAVVSWIDTTGFSGAGTEDILSRVLTVSGTTISGGADYTVDSGTGHTTVDATLAMATLSSTAVAHVSRDWSSASELRAHILTISGTVISVGSVLVVNTAAFNTMWIAALTSTDFVTHCDTGSNFRASQFSVSGTTITLVDEVVGETSANNNTTIATLTFEKAIAAFQGSVDGYIITFTGTGISTSQFTAAPMVSKPCDVDSDGTYIYIGALASDGTPILIKFSTALNADGSVVFEPGAGTDIGVETGRFDADTIWIAGEFDGTNVVEKSEDGGTSFSVKDPGTFGAIGALKVGPDSDLRILAFDSANSDLQETVDNGDNWTAINSSVSQTIKVIGRLGIDIQQCAFGNSSGDAETVTHSMSSGADLEELTGGDEPDSVDITGLIIN